MKKTIFSLFAFIFALVLPLSSADAAGNGRWDDLGWYELTYNATYGFYDSANVRSTGGTVKIRMSDIGRFELWESDPGPGNDDYVGSRNVLSLFDWKIFNNINQFVDGSNNRAELYVKKDTHCSAHFWD